MARPYDPINTNPEPPPEHWPLTLDHRCSTCYCYMPWAHREVIEGRMTKQQYEQAQLEQGRYNELLKSRNDLLDQLRKARSEIKKLKRHEE